MKEYKIYKEILDGQDTLNFRKFLNEVEEKINNNKELMEKAKEDNRKFYEALEEKLENTDKEYTGGIVTGLLNSMPRYYYIKNLEFNGKEYEAEIDVLRRRFSVMEVQ